MKLYLNFERVLTDSEIDTFRGFVRRRSQHEPLQHITGSTSFCGLEIIVNRHVLIPRPETELLAEFGWSFLSEKTDAPVALDLGTGSGCIAIALATKCGSARILATDISLDALAVAKQNVERHNAGAHVELIHSDLFAKLLPENKFDLIISNPPYIPAADIETLQAEVRDFDPPSALDGGADGLDFYRRIASEAAAFLNPHGKIMLEFGDDQSAAIKNIFENQNWIVEAIQQDYTHRPRILIAKQPAVSPQQSV